jgi:ribosomal protein S18 acetylase RimI-like enzyme
MGQIILEQIRPDHSSLSQHLEWLTTTYFQAVEEEFSHSPIKAYRSMDHSRAGDIRVMLQSVIRDEGRAYFLLARDGGLNIGYFLGLIKECPGEIPAYVGYVNGLYVTPSQRRQGIAQNLLNQGMNWFKEKNIQIVELYIAVNNQSGRGFWKKNGYESYEEVLFKRL